MRSAVLIFAFLCATMQASSTKGKAIANSLADMRGEECIANVSIETCKIPDTFLEDQALVETAIDVCYAGKKPPAEAFTNAEMLLKSEKEAGIPHEMRGMTLAAACVESSFNAHAEGDHKFSKDKKTPLAIGILQMWPCYEKAYGVDRKNVESSAKGWLKHIKRQVKSVKRRCKTETESETWRLAWVHGVRGPKPGGRCNERVSHWKVFMQIKGRLVQTQT